MTLFIALSLLSLVAVANLATLPVMFGVRAPDDNDIVKEDVSVEQLKNDKAHLENLREMYKVQNRITDEVRTQEEIRDKEVELAELEYKNMAEALRTMDATRIAREKTLKIEIQALEANGASVELLQQKKDLLQEINLEHAKEKAKLIDANARSRADSKTRVAVREQQKGALDDIFGTMLGIREGQKNILVDSIRSVKAGRGWGEQLNTAGQKVKAILSPMNIMASLGSKIWESTIGMAIAQDSALANLNKSVGAMGQFNDAANEAFLTSREFGVGYAEAAGAVQALHSSMADFTELSETAQKELTNFTAQMSQLGIESSTTAASLNIATKSLGLGVGEAQNMQKELFATAQAIGVAPKQLAEGFVSASPQLAAHGDKMIEVFKEMAGAAKATGIEMSALLQIAGQFDTFEGAAQAAGNLNAILGGDLLNSVELLAATEEERIRMLIQSIQLSGKSWESMNKFERQAIASAAGITDMNIANQMFNQSLSAYDEQVAKADASAISQKKMNEMMKEFMDIGQKVKAAVMSLAVSIRPLIEAMRFVLELFAAGASALTAIHENAASVIIVILGMAAAIYFAVKIFKMWSAAAKTLAAVNTAAKAVNTAAAASQGAAATASASAIGIQSTAMAAATPIFLAFGKASAVASVGVGSFALAVLAIGGAIALVGVGIAVIFFSMGYMFGQISKLAGGQILELSVGMLALAASMIAFSALGGPIGLFAAIGVAMLVGLMIAAAATASSFETIATSINNIKTAIDGLNETKLEALTMTMGIAAVSAPAFALAAAPLAAIAATTGTITTAADRGVVSKATPATGAPGAAGGGGGGVDQRPIQLIIDHKGKRIIAEIATEALAKDLNSAARSDRRASPWNKLVTSPA